MEGLVINHRLLAEELFQGRDLLFGRGRSVGISGRNDRRLGARQNHLDHFLRPNILSVLIAGKCCFCSLKNFTFWTDSQRLTFFYLTQNIFLSLTHTHTLSSPSLPYICLFSQNTLSNSFVLMESFSLSLFFAYLHSKSYKTWLCNQQFNNKLCQFGIKNIPRTLKDPIKKYLL